MNFFGTALSVSFCLAVLLLPRRQAVLAYLGAVLYITQGQALDVGGINMMAIRFVEVAAAFRVLARGEVKSIRMTPADNFLLMSFLVYMLAILVRTGSIDWYTIGLTVDGVLAFFSFRALISTPEDFTYFIKGLVFLIVPFAMFMIEEAIKGRNLFAMMGGVPETPIYRNGYFRCQGSFRHAITAGTFGATFFPIFVGFLFYKKYRIYALIGAAASLSIVVTSHSSGPLMATIVAVAAWGCWFMRQNMQLVRRGILAAFIGLHLVMNAPVWYIFDRISGVIGGDGWHRSNIIDKFIKSFGEWWLVGMPMERTIGWAATVTRFGFADITNNYVSLGINGGIISVVLFIAMLTACFKTLGLGLRSLRKGSSQQVGFEPVLWGVGSAVCVHAVNLTAVSYWDQSYVVWYFHLATAVTLGDFFLKKQPTKAEAKLHPKKTRRYTPIRFRSAIRRVSRKRGIEVTQVKGPIDK